MVLEQRDNFQRRVAENWNHLFKSRVIKSDIINDMGSDLLFTYVQVENLGQKSKTNAVGSKES